MTNVDKKIATFGQHTGPKAKTSKVAEVSERDGLFEQHDVVNRKLVSRDGRQLLREQNHEEA
jgi:hypothetical protein